MLHQGMEEPVKDVVLTALGNLLHRRPFEINLQRLQEQSLQKGPDQQTAHCRTLSGLRLHGQPGTVKHQLHQLLHAPILC